jgi:hypothetical protein
MVHAHGADPWRVRVTGSLRGGGVLLDGRHVLTCAHVVGDETAQVKVESAVCRPEWNTTARVVPGSWVFHGGDTRLGDVALLRLDDTAPCDARAMLWCAPLSGGEARAYGFPQAAPDGIWAEAKLGGDGGPRGELGLLSPVAADGQWIEPGYSGAGVVIRGGDHVGHVIGIVVADYFNVTRYGLAEQEGNVARAAWMMPTETIREYLPAVAPYVAGAPTDRLGSTGDRLPELAHGDTLRVALTQELRRLLAGDWAGTVVLPGGGTATGTSWLIRLVRTADPATRAGTSGAEFTAAPRDTVLRIGDIDAAYDAHGKSVADMMRYLTERFGLPSGDDHPVDWLWKRQPPVCLVVAGVDRAQSPETLVREVLRPLAVRARSRGLRLVLGFDGSPPRGLPHEVSLDPEPLAAGSARETTAAGAQSCVAQLAAAEEAAARIAARDEQRFRRPPALPRAWAPRLRVRLAVARETEHSPELAAISAAAAEALAEVTSFTTKLARMEDRLLELRDTLEAHRVRAERCFGAEDPQLGDLHSQAASALWQAPIDLDEAAAAVGRFIAEADRRAGGSAGDSAVGRDSD